MSPQPTATQAPSSPTLFTNAKAFEAWLKKHHATSDGLWLQIAKRGAAEPSVTYAEARWRSPCAGVDRRAEKGWTSSTFSSAHAGRARSVWSKVNVEKVAALTAAGRMQAPGIAQVDAAKADDRWARAYDGARTAVVPDDLQAALDAQPKAKIFFATINAANRYAVLWRIQTAVKPETRARRIAQLVDMLARGETLHLFKPKAKS
ncbi:MAG: YdeI/OmpD-associated family protein [Burkholderiaceae bacterium]